MKNSLFLQPTRSFLPVISVAIFTSLSTWASVEDLKVNSLPVLEKCYRTEPYTLEKKIDDKNTTKTWMNKDLIAGLCTEKAIEWAQTQKSNAPLLLEMADMVRRYDRHEEALGVYNVLFSETAHLSHCDNSTFYSTLISALSHPEDFPSKTDSDVRRAQESIRLCWAQKTFQQDILEEVETEKNYVTNNLCQHFRTQKVNLPAKCKK